MDELTKVITETQEKLIAVLNESQLHPMIIRMMLENLLNQVIMQMNTTTNTTPQVGSNNQ